MVLSSFGLAWLTYTFLETPIRLRYATNKVAITLACSVFTVGGIGFLVWKSDGFLQYLNVSENAEYLNQPRSLDHWLSEVRGDSRSCLMMYYETSFPPQDCFEQEKPLVVVWGDSYGASLYPGLRDLQKSRSFGLAQVTAASCPVLPEMHSERPNCNEVNANALTKLRELQPHAIILFSAWTRAGYHMQNDEISQKLQQQLSLLQQVLPLTRVVVVGPIPKWGRPIRDILTNMALQSSLPPPRYLPLPDSEENRKIQALDPEMRTVTEKFGAFYISPTEILCNREKCLTRVSDSIDGLVVIDHDEHPNPKAAALIVSRIAPLLF